MRPSHLSLQVPHHDNLAGAVPTEIGTANLLRGDTVQLREITLYAKSPVVHPPASMPVPRTIDPVDPLERGPLALAGCTAPVA